MKKVKCAGIFVLLLLMSAGIVFAAGRGGRDPDVFTLRFGHVHPEHDLFHVHKLRWAEAARAASNGRLNIEVFPSAVLGLEEDVLEQIRQGANMGWKTDFARLGSYVRELSVVNAPFFVSNLDEALRLGESATIQRLNTELAQRFGIANISFNWVQGDRHVFSNVIARTPDEFRGLRIRTPPAPIWVESVRALGATPTPLPFGEIYTALQTGVVEGCELPFNSAYSLSLFEVARYAIETGHIFQLNTVVVSYAWLNRLPEYLQRILIDTANEAGLGLSRALAAQTASSRQAMINRGVTVIGQDQLDMAAFRRDSVQAYQALGLLDVRNAVHRDIGIAR